MSGLSLRDGLDLSGLSFGQLWLLYASVGGAGDELDIEAYVLGLLAPDSYEHDVIAQALNEHFLNRGEDHPVAYSREAVDDDLRPSDRPRPQR